MKSPFLVRLNHYNANKNTFSIIFPDVSRNHFQNPRPFQNLHVGGHSVMTMINRWRTHLERSSLGGYICSIAGHLWAVAEDRTFPPLLQCCLTVDLISSYSGPKNGFSMKATVNISFDDDD